MKRPILIAALMALPALAWPQQAVAQTTLYVDNVRACAGLAPCYSTIMNAVLAAVPFDSIEVFPGVYHESVVFDATKNNIVLRAHSKALKPVIEAPSGGNNAVTIRVSSGVQVLNFVLEAPEGAGVATEGFSSDVLVQGNVIKSQLGVSAPVGSAQVIHNTVQGGGITTTGLGCVVARNTVSDGTIELTELSGPRDCVIRNNVVRNGGISLQGRMVSNTIASNIVDGGSITLAGGSAHSPTDNIVRHNVVRGGGIVLQGVVEGNTLEANFVSGSAGDGIFVYAVAWGRPQYHSEEHVRRERRLRYQRLQHCRHEYLAEESVRHQVWVRHRLILVIPRLSSKWMPASVSKRWCAANASLGGVPGRLALYPRAVRWPPSRQTPISSHASAAFGAGRRIERPLLLLRVLRVLRGCHPTSRSRCPTG